MVTGVSTCEFSESGRHTKIAAQLKLERALPLKEGFSVWRHGICSCRYKQI
jgi:hypothetical protein